VIAASAARFVLSSGHNKSDYRLRSRAYGL